jgi:DNA-binding protein HU-beta
MSNVYGQTLLDDMVQTQGLPMPLVREAAKEILAVIREGLVRDGVVNVSNFGTFRLKLAAARNGFNPQTRERITIPAHQRVIFSPCKALRELIQPVHQAPVPIPSEKTEVRAAAMSAPITSTSAIATKRIVPPPQPEAEKPEETETTPDSSLAVHTERRVTPDRRHHTERRATEATGPTEQPKQELQEVAGQIDELDERIDEIRLEIGDEAATQGRSNKSLYLGAAAAIVIAAVTASLMYDSSTDEMPTTVPPPSAHSSKPASAVSTETLPATTTTTQAEEKVAPVPVEAETAPAEELDYSTLYNEMASAQPVLESVQEPTIASPPAETTVDHAAPAQTTEASTEPAPAVIAKPVTTAQSKPTTFFFTEKTHKIASGESLWRLARSHYQDPLLWPHIYQANAAIISNPDSLRTGKTIILPSLQGAPGKLTKTDRRNVAEGYYLTYLYYKESGHKDAFFALLEAKRYDNKVVEEHRSLLKLSKVEEIMLGQQETMPF